VDKTLTSVGAYTVTEGAVTGYSTTYSSDCSGTIALGQTKTCTVTNDDAGAHLIVIKHVINENGGTKVAADFTLTIGGVTASGGNSVTGAESPGVDKNLTTVGAFTVTEEAVAGYTTTYSADCSGTIALNETKTCTVTNDDQAAHLIVIKHVVNDNGGTKVAADFALTIGGVTASGGNSVAGAESPGVDKTLTTLGTYTVTEEAVTGYTTTYSADCSGTIAAGQTKTCTVTNDDQAGHLIVIKHVINDNGGTKVAADFTLTIGGVTASGGNSVTGAESPGVNKTLTTVGAYTVTEGAVTGYTTTYSTDCSGTIAVGQTKTCTVTNDDVVVASEVCSPGFWKNHTSQPPWPATVSPSALFSTVFNSSGITVGSPDPLQGTNFGNITLLQALNLRGGGFNTLARQAAAAYLDSLTMSYPISTATIIAKVNLAFANNDPNFGNILSDLQALQLLESSGGATCPLGGDTGNL
jgi:hypothetical protein